MTNPTRWLAPLLVLAVVTPAGAQQWQVARDQFAFAGRQLTIYVDTDVAGSLRIIRGPAGLVRVSGRTDVGIVGAGLSADERLTLTATGDSPVEYLVSVPERVWIDIHLPDHLPEAVGAHDRGRTYQWGAVPVETPVTPEADAQSADPTAPAAPAIPAAGRPAVTAAMATGGATGGKAVTPPATGGFTVLVEALAPAAVSLPELGNVRSVTVRVEGATFRVAASRPLALYPGDPRHLEIRPAGPPIDLTIVIPEETPGFTLSAGGATALTVDGARIQVNCRPNTRQWLDQGRGWVTFTPLRGTLECGGAGAIRAG